MRLRDELTRFSHGLRRIRITFAERRRLAILVGAVVLIAICRELNASVSVAVIDAHITRLRNNHGQVICTLFTPSDHFPERSHKGMRVKVPIENHQATCRFQDVQYGDYAIVAFHDENHDDEFNQNWLGMPMEGFGFSRNPGTLKKPGFADAKFTVDQPVVEVTINLNYWL